MRRRNILGAIGSLPAALATVRPTFAQNSRTPIVMLVPYAAGGQTDVIARAIAASMQKTLGRTIVVENRPGAGGLIALRAMQAAPPDGNTLLMQNSGILIQPLVQKIATYDAVKDVDPVALVGSGLNVLMVTDAVPADNLADFIRYAKSQTKSIECANSGVNSGGHILAMLLEKMAGIELLHVAFKGTAPIATAMVAGEIRMQLSVMSDSMIPYVQSGKMKILGVTTKERSPLLPGIPAIGEVVRGYGFPSWLGLFAPAGTPLERREAMSAALKTALDDKSVAARLEALFMDIRHLPPQPFGELVAQTRVNTRHTVVDLLGLKPV